MRLHHLALRVADPERSRAFYADLLGLAEVARRHDETGALRAVWLRVGAAVLMLERGLRGQGPAAGSAHVLVLAVEDLAGWERRLEALGIRLDDRTPHTLFFRDPDDHRVGLSDFDFGLEA